MYKPKTAIISLTCCEGCQLSILDLGERLLDVADRLDIRSFRLASGTKNSSGPFDIAIIEGCPITKENFKRLNGLKQQNPKLKILISVGGWGWSGGFSDMASTYEKRRKVSVIV